MDVELKIKEERLEDIEMNYRKDLPESREENAEKESKRSRTRANQRKYFKNYNHPILQI